MRIPRAVLVVSLVALVSTTWGLASKAPAIEFKGSYDWSDGGSDELTAVFKPDGEGRWNVKFSFRLSGKTNNWKGSASGSLEEGGKLVGTSGSSGRIWEFEATVQEGVLKGKHAEVGKDQSRYETGTFEMRR